MKKILFRIFKILAVLIAIGGISLYGYWRYGLVSVSQLRENVYLVSATFFGQPLGANVVAIDTADGWVVVDTQLALLGIPVKVALTSINHQPVHTTIVTHWHPDHTGGNAVIGKNATRIAHAQTSVWMSTVQQATGLTTPTSIHRFEPLSAGALPTKTLVEDSSLLIGEYSFHLELPEPAHTGGDIVVLMPDTNIVHLGDILWPNSFTFADVEHGGRVAGTIKVLEHYANTAADDTLFVSGHGPAIDRQALLAHIASLHLAYADIEQLLKSGTGDEALPDTQQPEHLARLVTPLIPVWRWTEMMSADFKP